LKKRLQTILWLAVYFLMVFLPIILLMILPRPQGREFFRETAVALGFLGMALLGFQTIPTSRIKFFVRAFPMDTLYNFHHSLSIFTFLLLLAHPILLFINNPNSLRLLNLFTTPGRIRAAIIAMLAMLILVITSIWRVVLKIKYDIWRWIHDGLAYIAIGFGLYHMFKINYYMSLTYQKVIWLLLAGIWLAILLYIRLFRPINMLKHPYRVVELIKERGDCWSLNLEPVGHPGLRFNAGEFAWITTESPFIFRENPFSFATSSAKRDKRFGFTIKELGDFTNTIGKLKPGDTVYVDGPYGTFSMTDGFCEEMVYIAGGIGSAPVMSMLRTLADRGCKKRLTFFYGNPTWDTIIYREELEELEKRLNLNIVHVLEHPPEDWKGERGFINTEVLKRHLPDDYKDVIYFLCGPLPMIDAVSLAMDTLEIPNTRVFSEQYDMA
jgi:predicted ferric reductase